MAATLCNNWMGLLKWKRYYSERPGGNKNSDFLSASFQNIECMPRVLSSQSKDYSIL